MSQQVQELIDKIKKEGIQEGEQKARQLQEEARKKADGIIAEAKAKASDIIGQAQRESKQVKETTRMALEQISRDTLLNLRKEIQRMMNRIIALNVKEAMTGGQLAAIIQKAVSSYISTSGMTGVLVTVGEDDIQKIRDSVTAQLKEQFKDKVTFQSGADVKTGFTVSFDGGKSCFDFTDASLVEYISGYLNKDIASLLQDIIS